jgi:predicted methyltransferase
VVLADIPDNSVPLILTDPPYGDEAAPLYEWLALWARRVLIPGGSLICYTGQSRLDRRRCSAHSCVTGGCASCRTTKLSACPVNSS